MEIKTNNDLIELKENIRDVKQYLLNLLKENNPDEYSKLKSQEEN